MEHETEYGKFLINHERLPFLNKGVHFFNFSEEQEKERQKGRYYIKVNLEAQLSLLEKREKLDVESNLPFRDFGFSWYVRSSEGKFEEINEFLQELDDFCKMPLIEGIKTSNRKNTPYFEIRGLEKNIRTEVIKFDNLDFEIGKEAQKELKEAGIDFKRKVKEILEKQKTEVNYEVQKKVDRCVHLIEKGFSLQLYKEENRGYYSYSSETQDNSLKVGNISAIEYNQELDKINEELTKLEKEIGVPEDNIDNFGNLQYMRVEERVPFDKWFEDNKEMIEENYQEQMEMLDKDEENPYKDLKDYAEKIYETEGGVVEYNWEDYKEKLKQQ